MNWLITGVGSGLGAALAKAALARGDAVAGTVRAAADLAAFEALASGRAWGFRLDMADEAAIAAVGRTAPWAASMCWSTTPAMAWWGRSKKPAPVRSGRSSR